MSARNGRDAASSSTSTVRTAETALTPTYLLHLELPPEEESPNVTWSGDVEDNEGAGRRRSNKCWIYKKPKRFDESSSEEDDSDSDFDFEAAKAMPKGKSLPLKKGRQRRGCKGDRDDDQREEPIGLDAFIAECNDSNQASASN